MFYQLSSLLSNQWALSGLALVAACGAMLFVGAPMIRWLKNLKGMKWSPREDTPDSHLAKAGTPSMGGVGIIGVALLTYCGLMFFVLGLLVDLIGGPTMGPSVFWHAALAIALLPVMTACHALLGFADDWSKARGKGGLRARDKLFAQIGLALAFVGAVFVLTFTQSYLGVRFLFEGLSNVGDNDVLLYGSLLLLAFLLVAASNAVNLTDGIDGLAAGLCVQVGCAFMLIGAALYEVEYLNDVFWMCLAGACLGFLWFNKHPARVFMGDTGSLALGAAFGAGAILARAVWLLPFFGFIFWVEMFSVIFQVAWFKWTRKRTGEGKRLFRRAPLHHHFELAGWSEWRVVGTFWLVNALTTALGLLLWSQGVLPRWP